MKTHIRIAVIVVASLLIGSQAFAQSLSGCSNALLKGTYGFSLEGQKLGGMGPIGPQVGVALTTFDGAGNLTQIDTVTVNGMVVADFTHTPATGTYSVNANCTGTFTLNFTDGRPVVVANFVLSQAGFQIDSVVISAGGQQGILATSSIGKRVL